MVWYSNHLRGTEAKGLIYQIPIYKARQKQPPRKISSVFRSRRRILKKMKMPPTVTDRETIIAGIKRALIMHDRYTILFYLRDKGMLDDYAQRAADMLLKVI